MVTGRELRSTASEDGTLRLSLDTVTLDVPGADEGCCQSTGLLSPVGAGMPNRT